MIVISKGQDVLAQMQDMGAFVSRPLKNHTPVH